MKKILTSLLVCLTLISQAQQKYLTLSKEVLHDKIKGGWAGQTIGVTFGGPMEFRYNGTIINEYQPIPWYDGYLKKTMIETPGLYDDLYMDLTFVDILEKEGLDAPVESHAKDYANAGYALWHAIRQAVTIYYIILCHHNRGIGYTTLMPIASIIRLNAILQD